MGGDEGRERGPGPEVLQSGSSRHLVVNLAVGRV
jgi:hypothetical protein